MNIDPRANPNTAPIFSDEVTQAYGNRTFSFFFWGGVIVIAAAFFLGWFSSSEEPKNEAAVQASSTPTTTNHPPSAAIVPSTVEQAQAQGAPIVVKDGEEDGAILSFFEGLFEKIDDQVSASTVGGAGGASSGTLYNTGVVSEAILPDEQDIKEDIAEEVREEMFDGKILDYQGQVAGDIQAVRYERDGKKMFDFTLEQELTPADKPRKYSIPQEEVSVTQDGDVFFIQLNEKQTRALAEMLYDDLDKNQENIQQGDE